MQAGVNRFRQRAPIHAAAAANYLQDAQLLLARNRQESAASLLYEAAKSSINAIANLRGENPGPTINKTRVFREFTTQRPDGALLQSGWDAARTLHTHCDQHFLSESDLNNRSETVVAFVQQMLALFQQENQTSPPGNVT